MPPRWHDTILRERWIVDREIRRLIRKIPDLYAKPEMQEELEAAGLFALCECSRRFYSNAKRANSPAAALGRGAKMFRAYASIRVKGALYDALRREDRMPRHIRAKLKRMEAHANAQQRAVDEIDWHREAELVGLTVGAAVEVLVWSVVVGNDVRVGGLHG